MDPQRGHCRPRRHGENPARVVVAVHGGDDAAARQGGRRLRPSPTGTKKKSRAKFRSTPASPMPNGRPPASRKNENQSARHARLLDLHQRNEIFADRRRCLADRGGRRRGRAGGHRKSLGLRDRIRSAARLRPELDGPRTGELRARARHRSSRCSAAAWCRSNCPSARRKVSEASWISWR